MTSLYNARKLRKIIELDKKEGGKNVLRLRKSKQDIVNEQKNLYGFDPRVLLDKKYQLSSAGNHFYEIGLSLFQKGPKKRKSHYNPLLIFILTILLQFRWIFSLIIPDEYENLHIFMADFSHILDIKFHMNPALILLFLIINLSQLINFWDYRRGIEPVYLKPFDMMCGQCSPANIGLIYEKDIYAMVKILRIGLAFVRIFMATILGLTFTVGVIPLVFTYKWYQLVLFGVPWSLIMATTVYFGVNIFTFQILYFFITCFYLKTKLKRLNEVIREKTTLFDMRFVLTLSLIRSLNSVYSEIYEYNEKYWSKVSLIMISLLCVVTNLFFFVAIFSSVFWLLRILFFYLAIVFGILFLFYIKTNSMVTREAFNSYKLVNSLYFNYIKKTIPTRLKLKISIFIERIGKQNIGFYCGTLFIIDENIVYQILIVTVIYFLKIVEVSIYDR